MGRIRGKGISRVVRVRNLDGPKRARRNNHYGMEALREERQRAQERYERNIQGLGAESLQILAEIQGGATPEDTHHGANIIDDSPDAWEDEVLPSLPEESLAYAARDILDSR
ncbi:hypothetical protein C0992_001082 [Termitomyces sp. T32_za158]|nr:hypothetical protein C0992_001082 [Termitomyces sp. T32_za158]